MSIIMKKDAFATKEVLQIVERERAIALSDREWKHRLAGYGYSIRDTTDGQRVLETLPHGIEVCVLPQTFFS
ncbi:hypothetical protein [uncultured Sulfitobacter sp.]|uniref:hypothetical protein n=1 Tax=uncultured Sulfitobacter sp. TaxID=191468 RepID=UPI00261480EA|nr:hypothetical protein [uncultured Sulfitobacter sp.]